MKHLKLHLFAPLAMVLAMALSMGSCTPTPVEPNTPDNDTDTELPSIPSDTTFHRIVATPAEHTLNPSDTTITITVSSTTSWEIEETPLWCRIDPMEGEAGSTAVNITVDANHEGEVREAEISFNSIANISRSVHISQRSSYEVSVAENRFEAPAEGGNFTTKVTANKPWEIVSTPAWATVTPTKGKAGETTITIEVAPNEALTGRESQIRINSEADTADTIFLSQKGLFVFETDPLTQFDVPVEGDTTQISIRTNVPFSVESSAIWLHSSITEGEPSDEVQTISVWAYKNFSSRREATITITTPAADTTYVLNVTQDGTVIMAGNNFTRFRFAKRLNAGLKEDVDMTISGDTVYGTLPSLDINLSKLVPNFSVSTGAKVYSLDNMQQVSAENPQDFSQPVKYLVVSESGEEHIYTVIVRLFTGLPILYINTPSGSDISSATQWADATYTFRGNYHFEDTPETSFSIKGLDDESWSTDRKKSSYEIKLSKATSLAGMPEHKQWCLISNYSDRTSVRNMLARELGRVTDLEWTPRGVMVELVLNGTHRGNYLLSETIAIDKNRLQIRQPYNTDTSGEALTGGYILAIDRHNDANTHSFESKYITGTDASTKAPVRVKTPNKKEGNSTQFSYIEEHFRKAEEAICNNKGNWDEALKNYVDLSSIIDQWLIYEITATPEPAKGPYGYYLYKKHNDTRFYGGPLWDFNTLSFIPTTQNQWVSNNSGWIKYLWNCPEFRTTVKAHWDKYKAGFRNVADNYITKQEEYLKLSVEKNWTIHNQNLIDDGRRDNGDEALSYSAAFVRLRNVLNNRLSWLDTQFADWSNAGAGGTIDRVESDNTDKNKEDLWD